MLDLTKFYLLFHCASLANLFWILTFLFFQCSALLAKRRAAADTDAVTADPAQTLAAGLSKNFQFFQEKSSSGFVGLSNQGATCYLNSLVQTLYMTPELRKGLYTKFEYDRELDGPEHRCIPLQLQRLFARLQIGEAAIAETKELTKSFGFTDADAVRNGARFNIVCFSNVLLWIPPVSATRRTRIDDKIE